MSKSEDYLDHLLQDMSGGSKSETNTPEFDDNFMLQEEEQSTTMSGRESEKDFLDEFERELLADGSNDDDFLKQFEQELQNVNDDDFAMDSSVSMTDDIDGILDAAKNQMQDDASDNFDDMMVNTMDGAFESDDMDSALGDMLNGLGDLTAGSLDDSFMQNTDMSHDIMEDNMNNDFGSDIGSDMGDASSSDDDLMSLLGGESNTSDDQDLMALLNEEGSFSNMGEDTEGDSMAGIEESDPFAELAGMSAEDMGSLFGEDLSAETEEMPTEEEEAVEAEDEKTKKSKKSKKSKKEKKAKDDGEKEGFFAKLSKVLFGEDEDAKKKEDEFDIAAQTAGAAAIEELTDENLALLKELTSAAEEQPAEPVESPEEKKKREKKELKEKKAQERKEKKEQKAKEKKEKKANKPKKEKKPKPPKEPDNTPPLPKVPVILILVMAASMLALIMIGTNLVGYSNAFAEAESAYDHAEYVEAFAAVSGLEAKEADAVDYEKYKVMAVVAGNYDGYENLMTAELYDLALDSLVCTIGRSEKYKADAEAYGCINELNALEEKVENELKSTFGVSKDRALELYSYEEREDYSLALYQILEETGYEKVTEE